MKSTISRLAGLVVFCFSLSLWSEQESMEKNDALKRWLTALHNAEDQELICRSFYLGQSFNAFHKQLTVKEATPLIEYRLKSQSTVSDSADSVTYHLTLSDMQLYALGDPKRPRAILHYFAEQKDLLKPVSIVSKVSLRKPVQTQEDNSGGKKSVPVNDVLYHLNNIGTQSLVPSRTWTTTDKKVLFHKDVIREMTYTVFDKSEHRVHLKIEIKIRPVELISRYNQKPYAPVSADGVAEIIIDLRRSLPLYNYVSLAITQTYEGSNYNYFHSINESKDASEPGQKFKYLTTDSNHSDLVKPFLQTQGADSGKGKK